jgi:hypothetical protein
MIAVLINVIAIDTRRERIVEYFLYHHREEERSAKNRCNESKVLIPSGRRVVGGDRRNRPLTGGMPFAGSL